ncbi:hypothetical protein Pyn_06353 [Prunus yedoensis var. nudiflora]|uniref:Uncharacterized protein n=1 Tax=Prunus yedoensis var. nudiflora TaxID=2094558 RepID=A0A314UMI9_PRUYE|nr:hypothetical protein Pyn_06353 [Prunus yedoensis var. nudiflora]
MARSDEGKEVDIHAGPKGASGSSQANTPWFLEYFLLGTCSQQPLTCRFPTFLCGFVSKLSARA